MGGLGGAGGVSSGGFITGCVTSFGRESLARSDQLIKYVFSRLGSSPYVLYKHMWCIAHRTSVHRCKYASAWHSLTNVYGQATHQLPMGKIQARAHAHAHVHAHAHAPLRAHASRAPQLAARRRASLRQRGALALPHPAATLRRGFGGGDSGFLAASRRGRDWEGGGNPQIL